MYVLGARTKTANPVGIWLKILVGTLLLMTLVRAQPDMKHMLDSARRVPSLHASADNTEIDVDELETLERLNYGVSFSPITGMYTPTKATYNLMLVMDIPQIRATALPWKDCLLNEEEECYTLQDFCDYMYNSDKFYERTCLLLEQFKAWSKMGKSMMNRLRAYIELSTQLTDNDKLDQAK